MPRWTLGRAGNGSRWGRGAATNRGLPRTGTTPGGNLVRRNVLVKSPAVADSRAGQHRRLRSRPRRASPRTPGDGDGTVLPKTPGRREPPTVERPPQPRGQSVSLIRAGRLPCRERAAQQHVRGREAPFVEKSTSTEPWASS